MRAIDADALKIAIENNDNFVGGSYDIIQVVNAQPTIQPKTEKWIYCEDSTADCVDGYRCDQCGFFVPWDYKHKGIDFIHDYNFCPHCGAKMEVTT